MIGISHSFESMILFTHWLFVSQSANEPLLSVKSCSTVLHFHKKNSLDESSMRKNDNKFPFSKNDNFLFKSLSI